MCVHVCQCVHNVEPYVLYIITRCYICDQWFHCVVSWFVSHMHAYYNVCLPHHKSYVHAIGWMWLHIVAKLHVHPHQLQCVCIVLCMNCHMLVIFHNDIQYLSLHNTLSVTWHVCVHAMCVCWLTVYQTVCSPQACVISCGCILCVVMCGLACGIQDVSTTTICMCLDMVVVAPSSWQYITNTHNTLNTLSTHTI